MGGGKAKADGGGHLWGQGDGGRRGAAAGVRRLVLGPPGPLCPSPLLQICQAPDVCRTPRQAHGEDGSHGLPAPAVAEVSDCLSHHGLEKLDEMEIQPFEGVREQPRQPGLEGRRFLREGK